jgi:hypothetical protein
MTYGTVNTDLLVGTNGRSVSPASSVMRNRIINGAMVIDQRNAGASVTPTVSGTFTLDRWNFGISVASKFSTQQNAGAVTPPVGFSNYLGVTSLSAYTVGAAERFALAQSIEGFNTADLGFGTANAKTVTLSFQVYSSLTGTFGGALRNGAGDRSYPFTYSIPVANTWTSISVTIAGDTTGTWVGATNGVGLIVFFGLGVGSTLSGTAGAWATANYNSCTGATSVVGTSGATFYITGVQLEVGSVASSFEYRQYGQELALCQRYYETSYDSGTAVGAAASPSYTRWSNNGTANALEKPYKVTKRALPTVNTYDISGNAGKIRIFDGVTDPSNITPTAINTTTNAVYVTYNTAASGLQFNYTSSAEL